jgi:putative peptidoglycan lipid II flippase
MLLYRSFATVGGLTMISRVFGFVRDVMIAAVLGTGWVADAFFVAFRFPNLFRRLFGEGAFNSAFVPLFARQLAAEGEGGARRFAEEALAVLMIALLLFSALAMILMPWLMYAIAPGFAEDPDKFDLAVVLTQIAFPYLLCMSIAALLSGILNALGRFAAAAAAPIILNIVLIAVLAGAIALGLGDEPASGILLAWGVTFAGVLQLLMLAYAARNMNMELALRRPRLTPGVRRLITLGIPGVIAAGVMQFNLLIGTIIASLQSGAVSFLYYADRVYQLPLGVVGIAIGVVLLPDLSRRLAAGDMNAVRDSQNRSLEFALLLTLPAAVALFVVPEPIIRVLFERGAFTAEDTAATSLALAAFAWGLPAFVLVKVFSPAFFAREDTRTPMIFAGVSMLVNIVGSLALFYSFAPYGISHVGIAIATTLAGWVNALLLGLALYRRGHFEIDRTLRRRGPRIVLSSLIMGAALAGAQMAMDGLFAPSNGLALQLAALAALIVGGMVAFGLAAQIFGAASVPRLIRSLTNRSKP